MFYTQDMETELTIQQVSQETGLSIDTLRYYERIGLLESIGRTRSGHRRYTQQDLAWIHLLIRLRNTGMPRAQMVYFAQLRRQGPATITERRMLLEQHQKFLEQNMLVLEQHMDELQQKIARLKLREAQRDALSQSVAMPEQNETVSNVGASEEESHVPMEMEDITYE